MENELTLIIPQAFPDKLKFTIGDYYLTRDNRVVFYMGPAPSYQYPLMFRYEDTFQIFMVDSEGRGPGGIEVAWKYP
jgi:hypothetical protein